jgi:hypothetical protein
MTLLVVALALVIVPYSSKLKILGIEFERWKQERKEK